MTKLKTLEDLDLGEGLFNLDGINISTEGVEKMLRREAIKWIKELQKKKEKHSYEFGKKMDELTPEYFHGITISWIPEDDDVAGAIAILTHFFNITEEEINMDNPTSENKESKKVLGKNA